MKTASIHFNGHGYIVAISKVPTPEVYPSLDGAIRSAHAAGLEVIGVFGTVGGLKKPEEHRA